MAGDGAAAAACRRKPGGAAAILKRQHLQRFSVHLWQSFSLFKLPVRLSG